MRHNSISQLHSNRNPHRDGGHHQLRPSPSVGRSNMMVQIPSLSPNQGGVQYRGMKWCGSHQERQWRAERCMTMHGLILIMHTI